MCNNSAQIKVVCATSTVNRCSLRQWFHWTRRTCVRESERMSVCARAHNHFMRSDFFNPFRSWFFSRFFFLLFLFRLLLVCFVFQLNTFSPQRTEYTQLFLSHSSPPPRPSWKKRKRGSRETWKQNITREYTEKNEIPTHLCGATNERKQENIRIAQPLRNRVCVLKLDFYLVNPHRQRQCMISV